MSVRPGLSSVLLAGGGSAGHVSPLLALGVVKSFESSAEYMLIDIDGEIVDVGGSMNVLTPSRSQQRRTSSMSPNSCLVQVEPWRVTQEVATAARNVAAARTSMGDRRTEMPA